MASNTNELSLIVVPGLFICVLLALLSFEVVDGHSLAVGDNAGHLQPYLGVKRRKDLDSQLQVKTFYSRYFSNPFGPHHKPTSAPNPSIV
jgi:hypothetical protein